MTDNKTTLVHPLTGQAIAVPAAQAADWRGLGWLDELPAADSTIVSAATAHTNDPERIKND